MIFLIMINITNKYILKKMASSSAVYFPVIGDIKILKKENGDNYISIYATFDFITYLQEEYPEVYKYYVFANKHPKSIILREYIYDNDGWLMMEYPFRESVNIKLLKDLAREAFVCHKLECKNIPDKQYKQ